MKLILIIADKISIAKMIHKAGVFGDGNDVIVTCGFDHCRYKVPKLNMSQIPYTEDPSKMELRFPELSNNAAKFYARIEKGCFKMETQSVDRSLAFINDNMSCYEAVVISYIHPKTFEPDLPFKLGMWIEAEDKNKPKAYINRDFGRQMKHQRASLKQHGLCG